MRRVFCAEVGCKEHIKKWSYREITIFLLMACLKSIKPGPAFSFCTYFSGGYSVSLWFVLLRF